MSEETSAKKKLKPLNITCTSTDCERNLHCFRMTKKLLATGPSGRCRTCGVQLVDWARVHKRDLNDVKYTFETLRLELIRHHFWHIPLTQKAVNYARRKGRILLRAATENQIRQLVGGEKHPREGIQTPRETSPNANAIHFAQHATASCCRRCLAEWHGIPEGRALSQDEVSYLTALANMYLEERLPDLGNEPVRVPAVQKEPGSKRASAIVHPLEHQNAS